MRRGLALATVLATALLLVARSATANASDAAPKASAPNAATSSYPRGVFDLNEPSDLAPPGPNALPGYTRLYVNDFKRPLGNEWFYFRGVPGGDPSGRFDRYHVVVSKGMLKIGTWKDPRFGNNWVTGGVSLSKVPFKYGAVFVRSRETVPGPDTVELLWPQNNQWPPEIDFDEAGDNPYKEMWFDHYNNASSQSFGSKSIDITHWHTWGVIWTPSSVTMLVDGQVWGQVTSWAQIPNLPMTLDLQTQSWCGIAGQPCPYADSVFQIDWVEVYTPG